VALDPLCDPRAVRDPVQQAGVHDRADIARNVIWAALAIVVTFLFGLAVLGAVLDAADGHWVQLLGVPIAGLFWFWIAGGAWRRTTWGIARA
jgi:hypothetical protein